jgi:hypothetical protein
MNNIAISFVVDTTNPLVSLEFEAWLDGVKFHDTVDDPMDFSNFINATCGITKPRTITTTVSDDPGEHELRFVLKNKPASPPRAGANADADKDIINSACLVFSNLTFDDLDVEHTIMDQFVYTHDFNGTKELTQAKFHSSMGCNGVASLKFNTPIHLWLLENM